MLTVYLEVLEWDIEDGVVVDSRPSQDWIGTKVHNTDIKTGQYLIITPPNGQPAQVLYPVKKVEEKASV